MKLSLFIDVSVILLISVVMFKKKLPLLENIFIVMILEFLVSSYCAILYINLDVWEVANGTELFIIFRVYEAIMNPFIWLLYFNLLPMMVSRMSKSIVTLFFVGVQYAVEQWLVRWGVITYRGWHFWQSLFVQLMVLAITSLCLMLYRRILQKEKERIQF